MDSRYAGVDSAQATDGRTTRRVARVDRPVLSLAAAVSQLALLRLAETSMGDALDLVARLAVEVVPGATGATLRVPRGASSPDHQVYVSSGADRLLELEGAQGPSIDAMSTERPVHTNADLSSWPVFATVARRLGVRDVVAHPLVLDDNRHGCVSVYSEHRGFDQQEVLAVGVLATHASVAIANSFVCAQLRFTNDQLSEGLRNRETIGLAKGILMRQERCSEADAFRILVSGSQRLGLKVREVARHVVALAEGRSDLSRERRD